MKFYILRRFDSNQTFAIMINFDNQFKQNESLSRRNCKVNKFFINFFVELAKNQLKNNCYQNKNLIKQ